jgi:hypothetical protein
MRINATVPGTLYQLSTVTVPLYHPLRGYRYGTKEFRMACTKTLGIGLGITDDFRKDVRNG